jgi:flagellar FliL protein
MSDAAKSTEAAPKKGKKGLIIGVLVGVLLLGGGGGAAFFMMRGEADPEAAAAAADAKRKAARAFVTLDPFVVNLADRENERYAQIGVVLEVEGKDANKKVTEQMPAVRNQILLLISSKMASDLISREGKERLAGEIALAAAGPLGWTPTRQEPEEEERPPPAVKTKDGDKSKAKSDKSSKSAKATPPKVEKPDPLPNPISNVHFASFIVQ